MSQATSHHSPPYRPSVRTASVRKASESKLMGLGWAAALALTAFTVMAARLLS